MDEEGRVEVPREVRRQMGLKPGDMLVWIPMGSVALVRKRPETRVDEIRRRINELKKKAPECFAANRAELSSTSLLSEALREWALAKLGLRE